MTNKESITHVVVGGHSNVTYHILACSITLINHANILLLIYEHNFCDFIYKNISIDLVKSTEKLLKKAQG